MDPLSISVGVIALIGAASKVAVGLNKLASLREAPAAVLQLNNEVSELRLVLDVAEPLLQKHDAAVGTDLSSNSVLQLSIERANERLKELEIVVSNRLMTRMGVFDRLGWLKEQDKIRRALADLRTVRLNITGMLGVVTSSTSFRIETKLEDVHSANEKGQATLSQLLASQNNSWEKAFASIVAAQSSYSERLERMEARMTARPALCDKEESNVAASIPQNLHLRQASASQSSVFRTDSFSALRMRFLRQGRCSQWCDCACHTYTRTRTPQMFQDILGALFVGYTGFPALTPDCRNPKCRRSSEAFIQLNYYFPSWFLGRAVSFAMSIQNSKIPRVSMRVLNLRNSYEEIFQASIIGDAVSVEYLLKSGQASVKDISDDSGHSPLHCAVGNSHIEVIRVLLQRGAEPYLENGYQETPYDMASDNIFYFDGTPNASKRRIDEIRTLFPTLESVEERRRFTRIHKIMLQILHLDLEKELLKYPSMIDSKDADGRTPLSWAAARGDSKSVEALLRHGASPDTPDRIGQGPLRQAIKAHDASCAKLLLAYGAKVDQRDDWSQTCLLACMYYPNPASFAGPFIAAGAQVNVRCCQGRSPVMEAVNKNSVDALRLLLHHGADVNCANDAGATPLHEGIRHNSHEALVVLLETNVDHTISDRRKRTVLHWAAEFADLKTLNILCHERIHGLSPEDQDEGKLTAIEVAENRREEEEARGHNTIGSEWLTAFSNLLESLMTFNTPKSALSYTGSVTSEDLFVDALQHLTVEERAELEESHILPNPELDGLVDSHLLQGSMVS